jgi:hypothetical protein
MIQDNLHITEADGQMSNVERNLRLLIKEQKFGRLDLDHGFLRFLK